LLCRAFLFAPPPRATIAMWAMRPPKGNKSQLKLIWRNVMSAQSLTEVRYIRKFDSHIAKGTFMDTILIIILLLILFGGGGGGYYGYSHYGMGGGIGIFGVVLIIAVVLFIFGRGRG
jgi:hypothetical protein